MSVPDAVVAMIVAAVPGATLYDPQVGFGDGDLVIFDGLVPPKPPLRYVVVYPDNGTRRPVAVSAVSDAVTFRFTTHCVAPDRGMAAWLASRVADHIVDTRPVAAGWDCGQIGHSYSQPPVREEVVMERPVVNAIDTYSLTANRVA